MAAATTPRIVAAIDLIGSSRLAFQDASQRRAPGKAFAWQKA
jgi:hypothetical protein